MKEVIIATTLALSCSLDVSEQPIQAKNNTEQEQYMSPELQYSFKEFNKQRHLISKMLHD
jgi:hypothetical protein